MEISVHVELPGGTEHAGTLFTHRRRGIETRAFADCAPDRWGRTLIRRTAERAARAASRTPRTLGEDDYLLGVRDDLRQGALRFRSGRGEGEGPFLAEEQDGIPALTDLPELMDLADRAEADTADLPDLLRLVRAGSSLGGARPKAHVRSGNGAIAIAKFPSAAHDTWNVMAWEKVAHDLSNTDDHLRNHGFLHTRLDNWRLAPAFDLNPNPDPGARHLATAITLNDDDASIDLALGVSEFFRLPHQKARAILNQVAGSVTGWRAVATACGISESEQTRMAPAFTSLDALP